MLICIWIEIQLVDLNYVICSLSHCIDIICFRNPSVLHLQPESVILGLLPLFHGYGYGLLISSVIVGNNTVLLPRFEEKLFLSTIQKYKVSFNVKNTIKILLLCTYFNLYKVKVNYVCQRVDHCMPKP